MHEGQVLEKRGRVLSCNAHRFQRNRFREWSVLGVVVRVLLEYCLESTMRILGALYHYTQKDYQSNSKTLSVS